MKTKIKATDRVTVYRDSQGREIAVETCEAYNGHGCDGCKGLGFLRVPQES
jgi:hypothetical protein